VLKDLEKAIGLQKTPTKTRDVPYKENYPKHSEPGVISESDVRQKRRNDVQKVNREITVFGLDGRQLRFNVPIKSNKSHGDNYIQWGWKDEEGERKYLTVSLHGIVYYEEKVPQ
jgi:hypothetical protein